MIFGEKEFCKTCHIADHVQQCFDAGHQVIADGQVFKKTLPSYSIDDSDFQDGGDVFCNRCGNQIISGFPHHYISKTECVIDSEEDGL